MVTRTVQPAPFHGLEFSSSARIEIIPDSTYRVEIDAEQNLTGLFTVEVKNGILVIGVSDNMRPNVRPVIRVHTDRMSSISTSGSADVSAGIFTTDNLDVRISGSGKIGAFNISSRTCTVHISGSGNCEVKASEALDVHISGSGNVYYQGNPEIDQHISGSGQIINSN